MVSSEFVGHVVTVGGGIAASQAIALLFSPALTRLYGPEAFGAAAAFATLISIISPLSTLGYANAIVITHTDEEAGALARLSVLCALVVGPASLLLIHLGKNWLAKWTGMEETKWILYLIPMFLIVSALLSVANQAAIRQSLYKAKACVYVGSTLLTNLAKLVGGIFIPCSAVLILLTLIGSAINLLAQVSIGPQQRALKFNNWFGLSGVSKAARAQKEFAIYRMPQSVIRASSIGLPVIILSSLFGTGAAGQYSIAVLVLGAPVMLLGDSVGEVFYQKITKSINAQSNNAANLLKMTTIILIVLGGITFGATALFGSWIFPKLFGAQWSRAGEYSQWISLWMISMLASRPAISAMPAMCLQRMLLSYELIVTAARALALYLGHKLGDDLSSIAAFSLTNVVGYAALIMIVFRKLQSNIRNAHSA